LSQERAPPFQYFDQELDGLDLGFRATTKEIKRGDVDRQLLCALCFVPLNSKTEPVLSFFLTKVPWSYTSPPVIPFYPWSSCIPLILYPFCTATTLSTLSIERSNFLMLMLDVVSVLVRAATCAVSHSTDNLVSIDLIKAVKQDPRYLPILPTLFAVPPSASGANSVATMFYGLLDLEEMYPPNLRHCQLISSPPLSPH
jgi:hypothetical protein